MSLAGRQRGMLLLMLLLALLAPAWTAIDPSDAKGKRNQRESLQVGREKLVPCKEFPKLWCGALPVPLDRDDPKAGKLAIGFAWRPADRTSKGTLVGQEGGPGYPSIDSLWYWETTFGPLLKDHDLLMVDARGTGLSRPLACNGLQTFGASQSDNAFHEAIADCGRQLDRAFSRGNGERVHASDLFGTVDAVDDMAAVVRALKTGPIDLYGVSYGSFFAQSFAARHPEMVRTLTLDGTWPLLDADPWYPEAMETIRFAFDAVCERSAPCREAAPGSATRRLETLARSLAASPISGMVPQSGGGQKQVTVEATDLAALAWSAGVSAGIYRDLDAAGRAALAGDTRPLLRLAAGAGLNGSLSGGWAAKDYSVAHAVAVPCTDYPQLYDMGASPQERASQYDAEVAALPNDVFSPFALDDWLNSPIQDYNQCVPWPSPSHERELAPEGEPLVPRSLPVLILAGDLDSATALGGAEAALAQLGSSARLVVVPSSVHAVAQGDIVGCGSGIVRAFIRQPGRLRNLDTSCANRFPEIRARGVFPLRLAEQPLPVPGAGNEASVEEQRLAALAVATAGDVVAYPARRGGALVGLRGGTIKTSAKGDPRKLTLTNVRYAEDVAVSGTITLPKDPGKPITAELVATADSGARVRITATWRDLQPNAVARVRGSAGNGSGTILRVTMPAP